MKEAFLLHELVESSAERQADAIALSYGSRQLSYGELAGQQNLFASGLITRGLARGQRVAIFLEKRFEFVVACFGAATAGCIFVPINPLLKPEQVAHILRDSSARLLVTSSQRLEGLGEILAECPELEAVIVTDASEPADERYTIVRWPDFLAATKSRPPDCIDNDAVAIFYTSGSTGRPKGVVLSHRNMVVGARSVASYLENHAGDTLLAALPLSFDAGFSQLTTAFYVGARVVLLNYLLPRDVIKAMAREQVTGLTAVPPLYLQLIQHEWPPEIGDRLRYFANTGGRMPVTALNTLRQLLPKSRPFLMYGLTEAFRSTFLPPEEVDRRPDSIGKAIPNAEILVLRADGTPCAPNEPGELVHRGALVSLGYWNDQKTTAERFKPLPATVRESALPQMEIAVFSGDTVRADEEGFLYFIGRQDEMIKTSGYRVSPSEVEEIVYATKRIGECVAFGVEDARLGQVIQIIATPAADGQAVDVDALLAECRSRMPAYMIPAGIDIRPGPLARNPNGKIDRKSLSTAWQQYQKGTQPPKNRQS